MKEILLNKYRSDKAFVWCKDGKYFIDGVEYNDDVNILLNAIQDVKPITYHEIFERVDTKEKYWQLRFNYMYNNGGFVMWQNPSSAWEDELARRGEKMCPDCKKPMPKNGEGNLLMARNWLRNNEAEFNSDAWWDYLLENDYIEGNDTWTKLPSNSSNEQMKLFLKHFPTKDTTWEVSW